MKLRKMILFLLAVLAPLARSAKADLIFVGNPTFFVAPRAYSPTVGGGAGLLNPVYGPGGPLVATPDGFDFTDAVLSYTTTAADKGLRVNIDWTIYRAFVETPPDGMGTPAKTWAKLDGSVAGNPAGGAFAAENDVARVRNLTDVLAILPGSISQAVVVRPAVGPFPNPFANGPNQSPLFMVPDGSDQVLRQRGLIEFDVPVGRPAGSVYAFTLPNSWDSGIIPVPEPGTAALMSLAPLGFGFRRLRRLLRL